MFGFSGLSGKPRTICILGNSTLLLSYSLNPSKDLLIRGTSGLPSLVATSAELDLMGNECMEEFGQAAQTAAGEFGFSLWLGEE